MADSWGNEGNLGEGTQKNQNMISPAGFRLEVTDIEDDSEVALKASNKDGAGSVAIEAEGQLKVTAVHVSDPASKAVYAVNDSINTSAKAIEASGQCEVNVYEHLSNPALNALKVSNANPNANGRALLVTNGKSEFQDDVDIDGVVSIEGNIEVSDKGCVNIDDVNDNNDAKTALHTKNSSTDSDARALLAEGEVELQGRSTDNPASRAVFIENKSQNTDARAMVVKGQCEIEQNWAVFPPPVSIALKVTNQTMDGDSRALKVMGKTDLNGRVDVDGNIEVDAGHTLKINDLDGEGNALETINNGAGNALKVTGKSNLDTILITDNEINAPGAHLKLGTDATTGNVYVCHNDRDLYLRGSRIELGNVAWILSDIEEGQGSIEAVPEDDQHLRLGINNNDTLKVVISNAGADPVLVQNDLDVQGDINAEGGAQIGPAAAAGVIDSGGSVENGLQDLEIGGGAGTDNVLLSKSGKTTQVKGAIDVNENANIDGTLHVDGNVDTDGTLQVDGNTNLGGITCLNENELVVNSATSVSSPGSGCGLVYNPNGHPGPDDPCIDFYVAGAVVGWIDANGWHNVP
ncbi:hypothetical protein K9N50_03185 [bacterium]|nr:hypothetical protein [bacterium]